MKLSLIGKSPIIALTVNEVEHINSSISTFTAQAREKIPQSQDRDEVIEGLEQLRQYFITVFAQKRS